MVFYDDNEDIFGSVHPKFGRTVVWNDNVDFIFKPPSMQHISGEYSLFIKATLDKVKYEESIERYKVYPQLISHCNFTSILLMACHQCGTLSGIADWHVNIDVSSSFVE